MYNWHLVCSRVYHVIESVIFIFRVQINSCSFLNVVNQNWDCLHALIVMVLINLLPVFLNHQRYEISCAIWSLVPLGARFVYWKWIPFRTYCHSDETQNLDPYYSKSAKTEWDIYKTRLGTSFVRSNAQSLVQLPLDHIYLKSFKLIGT